MEYRSDINKVRNTIRRNVGRRVKIKETKGRNKVDVAEGVIAEIYPCVFLVRVSSVNPDIKKTLSFSYTDLLTKDVELCFAADSENE